MQNYSIELTNSLKSTEGIINTNIKSIEDTALDFDKMTEVQSEMVNKVNSINSSLNYLDER